MNRISCLTLLSLVLLLPAAQANVRAITTTTDLAWMLKKIGGQKVQVESLLDGSQDPHFVDAMPHWIAKLAKADIFCTVGLELEIGWVPKLLARASNKKIAQGGNGYCDTSSTITPLEVPKVTVDRSLGDIHPGGNPHYHLGPSFFLQGGQTMLAALLKVDSPNTNYYRQNMEQLKKEIALLKTQVAAVLKPVVEKKLMSYHREFSYFFHDFNLVDFGQLEEISGVPPSAGALARAALRAKRGGVATVMASSSNPLKMLRRFEEISGVSFTIVPTSIQKGRLPANYSELILTIANSLSKNIGISQSP